MANKIKEFNADFSSNIIKYYMDIINCMPDIVYWVDINCNLKGCNNNFVKLLGLKKSTDLVGTPYDKMNEFTNWPESRINNFKLDDMKILFSGIPQYNFIEPEFNNISGEIFNYITTRVPLFNEYKQIIGLVVIMRDINDKHKSEETLDIKLPEIAKVKKTSKYVPNILMVEDNLVAQKIEEELLKSVNFRVDIAESGDKALELFGPGKYDIVLMDIGLQDTSGYMVAKKIRQKEKDTAFNVPIIALTSYQADVVKYDCNEYSMDGVITKPLTKEQALQLIQLYVYNENVEVSGLKSTR